MAGSFYFRAAWGFSLRLSPGRLAFFLALVFVELDRLDSSPRGRAALRAGLLHTIRHGTTPLDASTLYACPKPSGGATQGRGMSLELPRHPNQTPRPGKVHGQVYPILPPLPTKPSQTKPSSGEISTHHGRPPPKFSKSSKRSEMEKVTYIHSRSDKSRRPRPRKNRYPGRAVACVCNAEA